jgi:hypothetical protein
MILVVTENAYKNNYQEKVMINKFVQPERPFTRCEDCSERAIIGLTDGVNKHGRVKKIGVCFEHYSDRHLEKALKWNFAQNPPLDTTEKRKKYVFETHFSFRSME